MDTYTAKRALLSNIIDYAGTFPPAALPLDQALQEAAKHRQSLRHPWLVGKMALPLADLKKINAKCLIENGADGTPWLFAALGTMPGDEATSTEVIATLEWELREINRFNERGKESSCRHEIVAYETRLPRSLFASAKNADHWLGYLSPLLEKFQALSLGAVQLCLEVPAKEPEAVMQVADALCIWQEEESDNLFVPGLKFRTGGAEVPSASDLAKAIETTLSRGLRFKATQGLHAAITHGNAYGFVNLFAALNLAQAIGKTGFPAGLIESCLTCEDAAAFEFEAQYFHWKEFQLDIEKIEAARRHHGGCFGSCSSQEPDESLAATFK